MHTARPEGKTAQAIHSLLESGLPRIENLEASLLSIPAACWTLHASRDGATVTHAVTAALGDRVRMFVRIQAAYRGDEELLGGFISYSNAPSEEGDRPDGAEADGKTVTLEDSSMLRGLLDEISGRLISPEGLRERLDPLSAAARTYRENALWLEGLMADITRSAEARAAYRTERLPTQTAAAMMTTLMQEREDSLDEGDTFEYRSGAMGYRLTQGDTCMTLTRGLCKMTTSQGNEHWFMAYRIEAANAVGQHHIEEPDSDVHDTNHLGVLFQALMGAHVAPS